jgi:hypothetical protein
MVRILLSVLQFRVNARYVEANPPFTGIGELAARLWRSVRDLQGRSDSQPWCGLKSSRHGPL